jgi:hypothetical protein
VRLFNKHVDNRLSEYLDGRLSAAEVARLEAHAAVCPACAVELDGIRKTIATLQTLQEVEAPRSFALNEAMVGAVSTHRPARWQAYAAPAAGMAVVFVLLLGGDLATSIDSDDDEDVAEEASQELLQMDELASEQSGGAERSTEAEAPVGEEDAAPADEGGEFSEESAEPEEEDASPLGDEDGEDATSSGADESAPAATPDSETIEQLEDVDEDDDTFRLFVRIIEALLAVGAFALGVIAFRRWRSAA